MLDDASNLVNLKEKRSPNNNHIKTSKNIKTNKKNFKTIHKLYQRKKHLFINHQNMNCLFTRSFFEWINFFKNIAIWINFPKTHDWPRYRLIFDDHWWLYFYCIIKIFLKCKTCKFFLRKIKKYWDERNKERKFDRDQDNSPKDEELIIDIDKNIDLTELKRQIETHFGIESNKQILKDENRLVDDNIVGDLKNEKIERLSVENKVQLCFSFLISSSLHQILKGKQEREITHHKTKSRCK